MTPQRWPGLRRVFRLPFTAARLRADVDAELEFHIQGRIEELIALGMTRDDAAREARRRFGDRQRIENEVERLDRRAQRARTWRDRAESLSSDVRYTIRALARQPMFVIVVVTTLTLGIGATAAIFHAVDRVVLHPLPYPDAERVVYLGLARTKGGGMGALQAGRFQFWHDHSRIFEALATYRPFEAAAGERESATTVQGLRITPDFLRVIGAQPALGRSFAATEFGGGTSPVAILSYSLWMSRFGGDRGVLGRSIRLNDNAYTIVGVMPESFEIAGVSAPVQILTPLWLTARMLDDGGANYSVIGRLRPGISKPQIGDDMSAVFAGFRSAHPERIASDDRGVRVMSYQELFTDELVPELWILFGATVFVFLLACANVGNIVLSRALNRQREFAVRAALGASRGRIVRQVLLEMIVLGIVSGVLATGAALLSVRGLVGLAHGALLRDSQLTLDPRVVVYTTLIALGASIVVGLAVALGAVRVDLTDSLAGSARNGGLGTRNRSLRGALVTIESALAMVLLAGAGLLISSFARVVRVDTGFRREGVFTATIPHAPRDYTSAAAVWRFDQRVLAELRATPGILSAGATSTLPLTRGWNLPTTVEGRNEATEGATEWRAVSPAYFRTMGVPLVFGRDIAESDDGTAPAVVVVSQSYASAFFPGENPIGRRILVGYYKGQAPDSADPPREIVGVVPDLRDASLEQTRTRHTVWVPQAQTSREFVSVPAFVVRANDAHVAATALRRAIANADSRLSNVEVAAMSDIVSLSLSWRRFGMVLMSTFALLALALTCVGIYGVASYSVTQRTQEIGVRMALGAEPQNVVRLVVRQGTGPAAAGLAIGIVLALSLSHLLTNMLFGVGPRDPLSISVVALLLMIVAVLASYIPARRASRIDPVTALRAD